MERAPLPSGGRGGGHGQGEEGGGPAGGGAGQEDHEVTVRRRVGPGADPEAPGACGAVRVQGQLLVHVQALAERPQGRHKEKPKFKASVVRFHQKSLVRQLEEAVILWRLSRGPGPGDPPGPGIRIMNSKGMYNRCSIKRLVLEDSESKALNEFPRKENDMNEVKVQDADETKTKLPSMIDSNSTSNKHASKVKTSSKPSVQTTDKQTKKSAEVITHYFKTK